MARTAVKVRLQVKRARYKRPPKSFHPTPLEDVLGAASSRFNTVGQRIREYQPSKDSPKTAVFFQDEKFLPNGACFQICTYEPGSAPVSGALDTTAPRVDLDSAPIYDAETGEQREVFHHYQVLVLGEAVICQVARGSGGLWALTRYLSDITRDATGNSPSIALDNILDKGLTERIARGGGIVSVRAGLRDSPGPMAREYAQRLNPLRTFLSPRARLSMHWESQGEKLDQNVAVTLLEAAQDDELGNVVLELANGDKIAKAEETRMGRHVTVSGNRYGHPNPAEVRSELDSVMTELLMVVDGNRLLTDGGWFASYAVDPAAPE